MCEDGKQTLDKMAEQDRAIMKLVIATERIAEGHSDLSSKMDKMIDSDNRFALVMERVMTENKQVHTTLGRVFDRIEAIEQTQLTTGCTALKTHLSHGEELVKRFDDKHNANKARIKILEEAKNTGVKLMLTNAFAIILGLIVVIYEGIEK